MGLFDWLGGKKDREKPAKTWKFEGKPTPRKPDAKPLSLEELRPEIRALVRPAWKPIVESEEGTPGATRFGGRPGLLSGETWPACGNCGKPMLFFLQVNLGEAPGSFGSGLLQFFYCIDVDSDCNEYEPFSRIQRVRIVDPVQVAVPRELPKVDLFPARRVFELTELEDLPNLDEMCELGVELSKDDERSMETLKLPVGGDKLGGWPAWVQNVEYPKCPECDSTMRTVFQLESEDNVPYMWGDVGNGHITQCVQHPDVLAFSWACC